MFYGDFSDGKGAEFRKIMETIPKIFGPTYMSDNLIALKRTAGFRRDEKFVATVRNQASTEQEFSLVWRLHTLIWASQQALKLDGDFVEAGVLTAYSFGVVTEYLGWKDIDKQLYLYDTYEGIPEAYNSEGRSNKFYQDLNASDPDFIYKAASRRFEGMDNVHLVRGIVPDSFEEACPEKIALLHLDMNSAASEIAALEVLWDKIVPGGLIVFDDYGWSGYVAQKEAEDKFMADRGHTILELPTGQGLLLKSG